MQVSGEHPIIGLFGNGGSNRSKRKRRENMLHISEFRMRRENREKVFVLLGVLTLLVCTGISPCFASVFQQGGENVFAAESGADPDNPESESALFGEGMIGPSQGTDQDSIFSQASKEEPHMDDRMETVIAQVEK